jgi:copper chaperone CopZ
MIRSLALMLLLAAPAQASSLLVTVEGMDCAGCNRKLSGALEALPFLDGVTASFAEQAACGEVKGAVDEAAVTEAVATTGYKLLAITPKDACPAALTAALPEPWGTRGAGLDVVTISHGETVDLAAHRADGKITIFDFGASWCTPCHEAAETLAVWLADRPEVAVRAIELAGADPGASYAQPVVAQHLQYVEGVPWFIVHSADGKKLIQTRSVDKLMAAVDKARKRMK